MDQHLKISHCDTTINKINAEISKANSDADYIRMRASEYAEKISKLEAVMEEIGEKANLQKGNISKHLRLDVSTLFS